MNINKPIVLDNIIFSDKNPYFFKNKNISDQIFIAQYAKNEENALYILDVWNREQYNIGDIDTEIINYIPFNRCIYNSNDNIKIKKIGGGNDKYNVLYYLNKNKIYYIALLPFNTNLN